MQGGALTLLGLGLAPFTAGGSLALTGVSMAASVAGGGVLVTSAAVGVPGEVVAHQWEKHYIAKSADEAKSVMLHCQVGRPEITALVTGLVQSNTTLRNVLQRKQTSS